MSGTDKSQLFSRLHELHTHGKSWKEIANILEERGIRGKGKALTDNALRKRYAKWKRNEHDLDCLQRTQMESSLKQFEEAAALPAAPENAIASGIASFVTLNNRLLEQIQAVPQGNRAAGKTVRGTGTENPPYWILTWSSPSLHGICSNC